MTLFLRKNSKALLLGLLLLLCVCSTIVYLTVGQMGHDTVLVILAHQFTQWNVDLPTTNLPPRDIANYYNNYYVYFGPLSSLLLLPFVWIFGTSVPQVTLGISSMVVSFVAVYFISKHFKFNIVDSLWLSMFFVFSTVLFSSSVINITAYQVEALGVPFILVAIWLYLSKRNAFFIGAFIGLAIMTRYTLVLTVAFFFFEMLQKRFTVKQFAALLIPVILALMVLGAYNLRRFHSVTETGYNYVTTAGDMPIGYNLKYGTMSIAHIPANLYSFLIMAPEPLMVDGNRGMVLKFPYLKVNSWGIAIWFTSPLFLLLLLRFKKGKYTYSALITTVLLMGPVFLWYSIGFAQFGYRYALDFLPFLFLLLLMSLAPKLSKTAIVLIIIGVLFNCIYLDALWQTYPLFGMF